MLVHQNDDPPQLKRRRSQFCKVQYEKLKRIAFFQSISFHFLPLFFHPFKVVMPKQYRTLQNKKDDHSFGMKLHEELKLSEV